VNSQFISALAGRNINQTSGTARAMLRQNMEALGANMAALRQNYRTAYNDIAMQHKARLAGRTSSMAPALDVWLPNTGGIVDNSSTALATGLIQAGLQGASVGISAAMRYGGGGSGAGVGGAAPMPFSERMG